MSGFILDADFARLCFRLERLVISSHSLSLAADLAFLARSIEGFAVQNSLDCRLQELVQCSVAPADLSPLLLVCPSLRRAYLPIDLEDVGILKSNLHLERVIVSGTKRTENRWSRSPAVRFGFLKHFIEQCEKLNRCSSLGLNESIGRGVCGGEKSLCALCIAFMPFPLQDVIRKLESCSMSTIPLHAEIVAQFLDSALDMEPLLGASPINEAASLIRLLHEESSLVLPRLPTVLRHLNFPAFVMRLLRKASVESIHAILQACLPHTHDQIQSFVYRYGSCGFLSAVIRRGVDETAIVTLLRDSGSFFGSNSITSDDVHDLFLHTESNQGTKIGRYQHDFCILVTTRTSGKLNCSILDIQMVPAEG